jgi:hypothetical protein
MERNDISFRRFMQTTVLHNCHQNRGHLKHSIAAHRKSGFKLPASSSDVNRRVVNVVQLNSSLLMKANF